MADKEQGALFGHGGGPGQVRVPEGAQDTAGAGTEGEGPGGACATQTEELQRESAEADQTERAGQDTGEKAVLRGRKQTGRGGEDETRQTRGGQEKEVGRVEVRKKSNSKIFFT